MFLVCGVMAVITGRVKILVTEKPKNSAQRKKRRNKTKSMFQSPTVGNMILIHLDITVKHDKVFLRNELIKNVYNNKWTLDKELV